MSSGRELLAASGCVWPIVDDGTNDTAGEVRGLHVVGYMGREQGLLFKVLRSVRTCWGRRSRKRI